MRHEDQPKVDNNNSLVNDDTLKKMLDDFSREVTHDFLNYYTKTFGLPAAIWRFDGIGEIDQIEPKKDYNPLTQFCKEIKYNEYRSCKFADRSQILSFVKGCSDKTIDMDNGYKRLRCSIGVNRLLFPIYSDDNVIGVFITGKYKDAEKNDRDTLTNAVENWFDACPKSRKISKIKNSAITSINELPTLGPHDIDKIVNSVKELLPIISFFLTYLSPSEAHLESLIFLETIETTFPDYVVKEETLWSLAKEYLSKIIDKIPLSSAVALYSSADNYTEFYPKVVLPERLLDVEYLPLKNKNEYLWMSNKKRGIVLPREYGNLSWMTDDLMRTFFRSTDAIIYCKELFDGKILLIGFGFKDDIMLSDFERLLLRKSALRLFKIINNALTTIETDNIMNETGHLLARAVSKIESGFTDIMDYGTKVNPNDPPRVNDAISLGISSIKSGLFRLDLIERNFKAFKNLRQAKLQMDSNEIANEFEKIDLITTLNNSMQMFEYELNKGKKEIKFNCDVHSFQIFSIPALFELVILNILDNAAKFAYRNTYIHIFVNKPEDGKIVVSFRNLGVGISDKEFQKVFNRHYQSIYRSPSKKRSGTGVGLAYCRQFMDLFYPHPKGNIIIESRANKTRDEKFDGDNYTTTLKLILPEAEAD